MAEPYQQWLFFMFTELNQWGAEVSSHVFQSYKKLLCFALQPDFGHGQPPKLQNMMKALFLVVKLCINESKQLHVFNSQAAETLIYEFNRDTPEAAKSDLLFYTFHYPSSLFFFFLIFYPCCRSTNVEYGCLKNGNFHETPRKQCHASV